MSFAGAFETYSTTNTELNDGSIFRISDDDLQIYWKNKNSAEFYKLLLFLSKGRTLKQPKFSFGKNDKSKPYVIVKADANSSADSIDVFDAYNCVAGDVLHNARTGEQIRIDAVDDTDTISMAATTGYGRGFGGTTAATVKIGDYLFKRGRVIAHKGLAPAANNQTPTSDYNYCEWWVKSIEVNKVQAETQMLDGVGQRDETYMRKVWEMDEEVNYALYFGKRNLEYEAEGALYTMNGVNEQILTHVKSGYQIAYPTWELFNEMISPTFDANSSSDRKVLTVGKNLNTCLVNAARAVGINPTSYLTKLGSTITSIDVDGGGVDIMKDYKSLQGPLSGDGFVIDSANIEFRGFNGFERVVVPNVQDNNDLFTQKDTIIQAGTVALMHEESHMRLRDFAGPFGGLQN